MPIQEERINTLEQSFTTLQKEVGKSIREVNEKSTILLGLLQSLTHESKPYNKKSNEIQPGLTLERGTLPERNS